MLSGLFFCVPSSVLLFGIWFWGLELQQLSLTMRMKLHLKDGDLGTRKELGALPLQSIHTSLEACFWSSFINHTYLSTLIFDCLWYAAEFNPNYNWWVKLEGKCGLAERTLDLGAEAVGSRCGSSTKSCTTLAFLRLTTLSAMLGKWDLPHIIIEKMK